MAGWYPEIDPFATGFLDVGDGHQIYYERSGNPGGRPALWLHGGPGSGCQPNQRRFFDPKAYQAILFDQRGSGRSQPLVRGPADLASNTTAHLIGDMERLREHIHVDRWILLGLSWGTTLGLAYAELHPERVAAVVLGGVTTTSRREVEWITHDMGRILPQEWERFAGAVPERLRHLRLVDAYAALLASGDPAVVEAAAREWCAWEDAHLSLGPGFRPSPRYNDPEFRVRFARLVTHYWRHAAFLEDEQLIRDVGVLNGTPGALIHGRYDISSPLETAWRLSRGWTTSELRVLDDAGHGDMPSFVEAVIGALDEMARQT